MARRSRMSILKRQRELKKSEKAARKRAKRHGINEPLFQEPTPTFVSGGAFGEGEGEGEGEDAAENDEHDNEQEPSETEHETPQQP